MRRGAALAAVLLAATVWGQQEPPREKPPRAAGQPRGSSSNTPRRPDAITQRQNPNDIIPLPPRPPRDRPTKFLVKRRGAATVPSAERGVRIVQNGGYLELRVDGAPFFIHSGEFPYPRVPRDLWETSLDRFRELGINTIALSIPWNWHEPQQGQFDFEGRSNPRRDLRALLRMIAEREFKLIVRLGPRDLPDWPHAGYPLWLLARPEHQVKDGAMARPRANPDAPAAANQEAMLAQLVERWLPPLFRELAPYSPRTGLRIPQVAVKRSDPTEKEISGPLILIQAAATTQNYLDGVRQALPAGALDSVPLFVSAGQPRSPATPPAMGEWFFTPDAPQQSAPPRGTTIPRGQLEFLEEYAAALGTQPGFPPMLIAYQAGGVAPPDEPRPLESLPANTLISTRLFLAHGLRGLSYSPLMDGITPAGYEVPGRNRYARWDAAFAADADAQPHARAVARTGQLLETWEGFLGSSHKRADFGLVQAVVMEDSSASISAGRAGAKLRSAVAAAGLAAESVAPGQQPMEHLLRHALILVQVLETGKPPFSEAAQRALVEYVKRGGTLAFFPQRPAGEILKELWSGTSEVVGGGAIATAVRKFGQGKVIEAIQTDERPVLESEPEIARALREFLHRAGAQRVVERKQTEGAQNGLLVTQIVSNSGTGILGERTAGSALLSVTNLAESEVTEELRILPPTLGAKSARGDDQRVNLKVTVPTGESLLLPMSFPLCATAKPDDHCTDEIIASGAELLRAERDGKVLELTMYVPAKATLLLKLARQPGRVRVDESGPQGVWTPSSRTFEVEILRAAAPDYLRIVKVHLPYTPFVPEKPDREKPVRRDFDFAVTDAARLPLASDAALPSYPPLIVLKDDLTGRFTVEVQNYDEMGRNASVRVDGRVIASEDMGLDAGELGHQRVDVKPAAGAASVNGPNSASSDPRIEAQLEVRSGRDTRRSPIVFVPVGKEGVVAYRFDFDRDAADEWVLEDDYLRLVFSPESGGRLIAVVDKDSGLSLTNTVGLLRDSLGAEDFSQRAYAASWVKGEKTTALRLQLIAAGGAQIEKTIRMTGEHEFEIDYRVQAAQNAPSEAAGAAFVTAASVPVVVHRERTTRFCWPRTPRPAQAPAEKPAEPATEEDLRCETFVPGEKIEVPAEMSSLQVRTPGSFAQRLEWQGGGRMLIEMKQYTALLKLQFAPAAGTPANYKIKYGIVVVE